MRLMRTTSILASSTLRRIAVAYQSGWKRANSNWRWGQATISSIFGGSMASPLTMPLRNSSNWLAGATTSLNSMSVFANAGQSIAPTTLAAINYTRIEGFNVANDVIRIDAGTGGFEVDIEQTDATAVVNPPAIFNYALGTNPNLSALSIDMIKIDTAIGGLLTPDALFDAAIGANNITVNAPNGVLFAVYSNTTQSMTLFAIDNPGAFITAADDVDVVGVVSGMSFADYQTFGNNGSLVFT